MADIDLTLGIFDYDHVRDLTTGRLKPEGINLTCLQMAPAETFGRFLAHQDWDVSELSFGNACAAVDRGDAPFVLIPVFPSRVFRISAIFIRADGDIAKPEDLAGKRVGQPKWTQSATIYARGWLTDTVGIPLADIKWFQMAAASFELPGGATLTDIPGGSLTELLLAGELDAIIAARPPPAFLDGDPRIARLVPDYRAAEEAYFDHTGIFPIMHAIVIRRETYDAHRWIARNLFDAFDHAKNNSVRRLHEFDASQIAVPWMPDIAKGITSRFFPNGDYWPYGIEQNRTTLEAFLKYCFDQGVTRRHLAPDDLFVEQASEPAPKPGV
jgi:4,5-dihydroxyphthalate decarboxylase